MGVGVRVEVGMTGVVVAAGSFVGEGEGVGVGVGTILIVRSRDPSLASELL